MNKNAWYWLLGLGGLGAVYFVSKASATATGKETGDPIPPELINPPPENAPPAPAPAPSQTAALTTEQRTGPLVVVLGIKVSGMEKAFSSEASLLKKARAAAINVGSLVATNCPGAPLLQGNPAVSMKDVDGGYRFTIVWAALWSHARAGVAQNVRDIVLSCIKKQLQAASSEFNQRLVSIRAYRA